MRKKIWFWLEFEFFMFWILIISVYVIDRIDCLKTFLPFEEYFLLSLFPCSLPWLSRKRNGSRTAYAYLYASSTWISWYEYDKALEFENSRCQSYKWDKVVKGFVSRTFLLTVKWVSAYLIPNTTPCNALQKLGDIWNSFDQGKYDEVGVKGRSLGLQREE